VKVEGVEKITLSVVENGTTKEFATTQIGTEGSYGFSFIPTYEGFYVLEYTQQTTPITHLLYLKPGDVANLDISPETAMLTGKNTDENKELYKWVAISDTIRNNASYFMLFWDLPTYVEFFPAFEKLVVRADNFKKMVNTKNGAFNKLFREMIDCDLDYYFLSFLCTPRTKHPEKTDRTPYHTKVISKEKLVSDNLLKFPYSQKLVEIYLWHNRIEKGISFNAPVDVDLEYVSNPILKGEYLLSYMKRIKSYELYTEFMKTNGHLLVTKDQKERAENIGSDLYQAKVGTDAADFLYPDQSGKMHSLSNYKGKVIVVDVWATWCSPCRQQFPYLKKLEEEMKGKDVVFIGITIDAEKDKEKWIAMIQSEGLPGIHLFAGKDDNKITKDYKITGIPRYMVFDKQGKIVDADSPRPSDPKLKEILETELAK
jgi:thiol-disulfide isomerase/thioredoxin